MFHPNRSLTIAVIFLAAASLVGYDLWAFATVETHDTLSEVMRDAGAPAAYATGFLAGHFFIQLTPRRLPHVVALLLGLVGCVLVSLATAVVPRPWDAVSALVVGSVAGAMLWPQEERS
jgi:hypothetical protein